MGASPGTRDRAFGWLHGSTSADGARRLVRRAFDARTVDVLQADASGCGGASHRTVHVEYFYDHARIERMPFDGTLVSSGGLTSDASRPGLGIELKERDAERFAI
jgi:hypothetical protein